MLNLRSLVLVLAFCAFTSAASADDFWMSPLPGYGAPLYAAPAYVAPSYFAPARVPSVGVPSVVVPAPVPAYGFPAYVIPTAPSYDYPLEDYAYDDVWLDDAWDYVQPSYVPTTLYDEPPCDDYTDLLLLNWLESIDQTLRNMESEMREARHQRDWDRILGSSRH
jgi:hypothetical protein